MMDGTGKKLIQGGNPCKNESHHYGYPVQYQSACTVRLVRCGEKRYKRQMWKKRRRKEGKTDGQTEKKTGTKKDRKD